MGRLKTNQERRWKQALKKGKPMTNSHAHRVPTLAPGLLPGVKPDDLKKVTCRHCREENGKKFISINELRQASPFQTTTGKPMLVNFQGFACSSCGKINEFSIEGVTAPQTSDTNPKLN
jgi:hypothetical protein